MLYLFVSCHNTTQCTCRRCIIHSFNDHGDIGFALVWACRWWHAEECGYRRPADGLRDERRSSEAEDVCRQVVHAARGPTLLVGAYQPPTVATVQRRNSSRYGAGYRLSGRTCGHRNTASSRRQRISAPAAAEERRTTSLTQSPPTQARQPVISFGGSWQATSERRFYLVLESSCRQISDWWHFCLQNTARLGRTDAIITWESLRALCVRRTVEEAFGR